VFKIKCLGRHISEDNNIKKNLHSEQPITKSDILLLTVHLFTKFLLVTNLTQFFTYLFIYFVSLHVSSITVLIIRRSNCINTSSGMISLTGIPSSHTDLS